MDSFSPSSVHQLCAVWQPKEERDHVASSVLRVNEMDYRKGIGQLLNLETYKKRYRF